MLWRRRDKAVLPSSVASRFLQPPFHYFVHAVAALAVSVRVIAVYDTIRSLSKHVSPNLYYLAKEV